MDIHRYQWISMDIRGLPVHPGIFPRQLSGCVADYWHHLHDSSMSIMDIHGYPWISMDIHRYQWISMDIRGLPVHPGIFPRQLSGCVADYWHHLHDSSMSIMDIHGYPWISMDIHRYQWISIDIHRYQWISMVFHRYPWISMDVHEYC